MYLVHGTPLFLKKYKSTGTCTVVHLVHVRTRLIPAEKRNLVKEIFVVVLVDVVVGMVVVVGVIVVVTASRCCCD